MAASDVFVVVTANVSLETNTAWPGSAKIWRVDARAWELVSISLFPAVTRSSYTAAGATRACIIDRKSARCCFT
jgi:hypothetical protein